MTRRLSVLLRRAKQILQNEGRIPLVRQGIAFVLRRFYQYGTYDLYEIAIEDWLKHRNEVDHLARRPMSLRLTALSFARMLSMPQRGWTKGQ